MHERVTKIINEAGIQYRLRLHADLGEIHSPDDFAAALGYDLARITKTLLLRATAEPKFFLAVAPIKSKIGLKRLAGVASVRRLQMASRQELSDQLDYPPNGVSPIGSQSIPVFLDSSLLSQETILIGAGVAGEEIELSPQALQDLIKPTLI
jgi:Cys-tRNA(Pro)/Cys-tRNA(Cys) deacylase